jgi:xanthine dehydrogenase accessory factor
MQGCTVDLQTKVLIKGAGEQASGTAHRLFRCGFRVVMTDIECPTAVRRTVSFCSAIGQKEITIEGVVGAGYTLDQANFLETFDWRHIPVFIDPESALIKRWKPDVVVDGRMLKRNVDNSMHDAALVIGYGPGLVAGQDVHVVVETSRGHDLGRIITDGSAAPDTGVPGVIGGFGVERVLRAPVDGILRTARYIGDRVEAGDPIGTVDDGDGPALPEGPGHRPRTEQQRSFIAEIPGVIRGLLLPGTRVVANQKVGDIDPRGVRDYCFTLSDKARTISGAALEIIVTFFHRR